MSDADNVLKPSCVAFAFDYVNKKPRVAEETLLNASVQSQLRSAVTFAAAAGLGSPFKTASLSTYRRQPFLRDEGFLRALALAKRHAVPIIVANVFHLLRTLDPQDGLKALNELQECGVEVYDVSSMLPISAIGLVDRKMRLMSAVTSTMVRSGNVKRGLKNSPKPAPTATTDAAYKKIKRRRPVEALIRARRLAPIVKEIEAAHPGSPLSPSVLARELNRRGERAPRGGEWSVTSAKTLLGRIAQLSAV